MAISSTEKLETRNAEQWSGAHALAIGCLGKTSWRVLRDCSNRNLTDVPKPQEIIKYMLSVHLQVRVIDLSKHLKQIMVRPYVLVALLNYLIEQNHEVFRGKGSAEELRERMRKAVEKEYPETEADKPHAERKGAIPTSVLELLAESQADDHVFKNAPTSETKKIG